MYKSLTAFSDLDKLIFKKKKKQSNNKGVKDIKLAEYRKKYYKVWKNKTVPQIKAYRCFLIFKTHLK